MKQKVFILAALIAMAAYFVGVYVDDHLVRMVSKPIPLILFLIMLKPHSLFKKYVFAGLLLSVLGDLLLEASPNYFIFGLLAFLTAHIAYILAFVQRNRDLHLLPALFLMVYGVIIYWILFPGLHALALPVLFYVIVILTMVWRAIAQYNYDRFAVFAVIGALFFVASDSLIAINKFYTLVPYSRWLIMLTYWLAQSLIFYSAYSTDGKVVTKKA